MRRPIKKPEQTPAFLGIAVGKRRKAKADAKVKEIEAQNAAELKLLAAKTEASKSGYKTEEEKKADAVVTTAAIESQSNNNLYYIIGGIVLVVIIGLYFITKSK